MCGIPSCSSQVFTLRGFGFPQDETALGAGDRPLFVYVGLRMAVACSVLVDSSQQPHRGAGHVLVLLLYGWGN